jgi:hypothetical protein
MNPVRWISRRITRAASGIHLPETYSVSDWIIQPPLITAFPYFQLSDTLVSDNLCLAIAGSRPSVNLLPQIPTVYEVSELLVAPNITDYSDIKISVPEIFELTDWLVEATIDSEVYCPSPLVKTTHFSGRL